MKAISLKNPKVLVRSILLLIYVAVLVIMLLTGKRHTILIDNKDAGDGSYLAIDGMSVQIDKQEAAEYYPGDRDRALVNGQKHTIKVEIFSDGKIFESSFALPLGQDMVLLSVPKLVAGIEPYIEPFSVQLEQASAPEAGPPQGMQFGGDSVPPAEEAAPTAPALIQ